MPAPATIDEFVDLIRKSNVLEEPRLATYVGKLKSDPQTPADLNSIAGLFVRDGLLTYFQAEQFLQGRWKRFNIGKYKVLERLGSGGMGQVFLCEHKLMRRRVAVKVLPTAKAADPSSLDRFYREARAVAALDHTNIVRAYDIDQDDNLHFLVMEYVDGASLQDMVRKINRMDVTRACHYVYWSAVGLQHAHEAGLIHRDIKPGNILVDRQGVVKILDLGLARFFNDDDDLLTKKYDETVLGTADYLAPEQAIDSHSVDGRADIYSLGATFYFMLTGHPPFTEGTVAQKLLWHQTRQPKRIRDVRPEVPVDVAAILEKMMAKKAEDRYQTPHELAEALLPFTQSPIDPPPDEEMPQLSLAATAGVGTASATTNVIVTGRAPRTPALGPRTQISGPGSGTGSGNAAVGTNLNNSSSGSAVVGGPSASPGVADAETRRTTAPVPTVEPIPDSVPGNGPAVWENLGAETANASRGDTLKSRGDSATRKAASKSTKAAKSGKVETQLAPVTTKSAGAEKAPSKKKSSKVVAISLIGLVFVAAAAAGIYFGLIRDKSKTTQTVAEGGRKLIVSKSAEGGPHRYTSVRAAAADFRSGDEIVIMDPEWEESITISSTKNLVLVGGLEKPVVWKLPNTKSRLLQAVSIAGAEGGRLANIHFRLNNGCDTGIRLSGRCPGFVIEDVEVADANLSGITLFSCVGEKSRPVVIQRCRILNTTKKDTGSAFTFSSEPSTRPNQLVTANSDITIRDCRIEGPFKSAAFDFDGSTQSLLITHNRVFLCGDGVRFREPRPEVIWKAGFVNNTFHTLTGAAVKFDNVGPMKKPENKLTFDANYLTSVGMVVKADGDAANANFVSAAGNFRKRGTPEGAKNLLSAAELDADLSSDTNSKMFLGYGKSHPLSKAFQNRPVGAVVPE